MVCQRILIRPPAASKAAGGKGSETPADKIPDPVGLWVSSWRSHNKKKRLLVNVNPMLFEQIDNGLERMADDNCFIFFH